MKNNYSAACKELLEDTTPEEWISYLFDLQNSLIGLNYFESFTDKGSQKHADYFGALKEFFSSLQTKKSIT